jgi:hypothetical protein
MSLENACQWMQENPKATDEIRTCWLSVATRMRARVGVGVETLS